jgi:peptidase M24-like protein
MSRPVQLGTVALPDFGVPERRPAIQAAEHHARMDALQNALGSRWIVVYGDREHFANLTFLCGFDPRFEEALLLLGPVRRLVVGLEGEAYAGVTTADLDVVVCPSLSLMGQDRSSGPTLESVLREAGLRDGDDVAVVGWKALGAAEWGLPVPAIAAPAFLVDLLRHVAGAERVTDATLALTAPTTGLRVRNSATQLAAFEWAAARSSAAVQSIVGAARPGATEQAVVSAMRYAGEPLSAHVMFSSGPEVAVGLRSPTTRTLADGEAVTTGVGFWGGLTCRAGRLSNGTTTEDVAYLERMALPYWHAVATWYEHVTVGVSGGAVHAAVLRSLEGAGFAPALNPGHLVHLDEWVHSPIRPEASDRLASGMALQCDIIPSSNRPGWVANCEDTVALADAELRGELEREYPSVWARIAARRAFMADILGVRLADDVLPLSNAPAWFPPFWLTPDRTVVRSSSMT